MSGSVAILGAPVVGSRAWAISMIENAPRVAAYFNWMRDYRWTCACDQERRASDIHCPGCGRLRPQDGPE